MDKTISGQENSFLIFNGEHPQCMASHRKVMIDFSIEMAEQVPEKIKEQQIYYTYPAMLTHLLVTNGRGTLKTNWINPGEFIYRYDYFHQQVNLGIGDKTVEFKEVMPMKPVHLLKPSHFSR
jgi:hypothetical protein